MNLDTAAHIAELISALVGLFTILGVSWKVVRTCNRILQALHLHREREGTLRAEGIHRLFRVEQ